MSHVYCVHERYVNYPVVNKGNGVRGNCETEIMLYVHISSIFYTLALLELYVQGSPVIMIILSLGCQST